MDPLRRHIKAQLKAGHENHRWVFEGEEQTLEAANITWPPKPKQPSKSNSEQEQVCSKKRSR
jgi:hypothetical protein